MLGITILVQISIQSFGTYTQDPPALDPSCEAGIARLETQLNRALSSPLPHGSGSDRLQALQTRLSPWTIGPNLRTQCENVGHSRLDDLERFRYAIEQRILREGTPLLNIAEPVSL